VCLGKVGAVCAREVSRFCSAAIWMGRERQSG
jgi:hypothetical protein